MHKKYEIIFLHKTHLATTRKEKAHDIFSAIMFIISSFVWLFMTLWQIAFLSFVSIMHFQYLLAHHLYINRRASTICESIDVGTTLAVYILLITK